MPRLLPGEDPKIDMINGLVVSARDGDKECMQSLLALFHPLILKICKRWSIYFGDDDHTLIPFSNLVADAQYWFIHYTLNIYTIDGAATYNKFIKDHIMQRIRYIYECELKYAKRHIFPDPDKNGDMPDCDKQDMLEDVIHKYGGINCESVDVQEIVIDKLESDTARLLANAILFMLDDRRYFTEREKTIFIECEMDNITHEAIGRRLGISRTRVSQIMARTKEKLMIHMNNDRGIRRLIIKWRA